MPYPPHGAALDVIFSDIDARLHTLETAPPPEPPDLTALTGRVTALEEADEELTGQIEILTERANAVTSTLGQHSGGLEALAVQAGVIRADLTLAEQAITATNGRIDTVEANVGTLTADVATHGTNIASLGNAFTAVNADLNAQQVAIDDLATRVSTIEGNQGAAAVGWPGYVSLASFAGADATAKFRAALTYAATATPGRQPAIILPPGTVLAPGTNPFMLFNGAAIVGGVTPETEFSLNSRVSVSGAAPNGVFDHPNDARSITIANIGWEGPGLSQVCRFMADNTNRLCYSLFSGVSFDNFTSVLRKRFLGFLWQGSGYCNNSAETPFEFSGSDYKVFMDGYYLDSPNLPDTAYLLHIKSGNKVTVGEMFVTGDGPTPVRVSGGQMVRLRGLETEAEGVPRKTAGAALFVSGGNVVVDNLWAFRTMYNPAGTGRGDNGVIHAEGNGTLVRVKHATFGEYNTTPEKPGGHTENHVFAGGSAKVYLDVAQPWNMQAHSGVGGTTNARPLQIAKAGTGQIHASSYTAL